MYPESNGIGSSINNSMLKLSSEDLPDIKEWATGQEYVVVLHVKQKESHLEGDDEVCAYFEICGAKTAPSKYSKSIMEEAKNE